MLLRLLCFGLILLSLSVSSQAIQLGIDRLEEMQFAPLMGKRVGLITNQTGLAAGLFREVNRRGGRPNFFERSLKDKLDIFFKVYGTRSIRSQLENALPLPRIVQGWEPAVNRFEAARGPYLLY